MATMTLRAYARHRGVSPSTICKALASDRLTLRSARRVGRRWQIDPGEADRELRENADPGGWGGARRPVAEPDPLQALLAAADAVSAWALRYEDQFQAAFPVMFRRPELRVTDGPEATCWKGLHTTWAGILGPMTALQDAARALRDAADGEPDP